MGRGPDLRKSATSQLKIRKGGRALHVPAFLLAVRLCLVLRFVFFYLPVLYLHLRFGNQEKGVVARGVFGESSVSRP